MRLKKRLGKVRRRCGRKVGRRRASGREVRMHDRKRVEVALAALVGVPKTTAWRWSVGAPAEKLHREALGLGYDGRRHHRSKGGAHVREGAVRPAGDRAPRGARAGPDREHAAQGGAGRPKSGRLGPGFDLEQEQVRARREIEAGDRPAPPLDHRFLEDIEELL